MEGAVGQQVKIAFYETSLMLQQPLPMPKDGSVYYAPMRDWFTEPFVTNGSLVYSGMWSPTGARSPLVLLLVGEVLKSHNKNRVAWRKHMPLLVLCVFLGLDHCRPLVREESKQLLVNMLRVICPRIDLLQMLSLQLEIDSQWIARAVAGFSTHVPQLFLTLDDGPSVPKFSLPVPTDTALSEVSSCPTWAAASYSASPNNAQSLFSTTGLLNLVPTSTGGGTGSGFSPMTDGPSSLVVPHPLRPSLQQPIPARPNYIFGSTYSLMSTATLIPSAAISSGEAEPTNRRSIITSDSISPSQIPPHPPSTALHPISQVQASKTPKDDCESRHLHAAAELINQMLVEVNDRSIWTWEDITSSRFQQATLLTLRSRKTSILLLRSARFLDKFVKCVAGAFAEAEVGGKCTEAIECLQCHHGPPHHHCELESEENCQQQAACTVTRFAQAAFNMGITCPNRHYASRSLQIYRALGAQVDEKALSEVLVRLMESVSDTNDEVQGYMVELLLTLEAAVEHIQLRGTILSGGGNRSCTLARSSALESPIVISKPPQTPPVHERKHSRRGSSSSLSSLLILPNGSGGTVIGNVGVCGVGPQASLPPIKRPLMPPHAEAVGEENEASASTAAISTVIGLMKTTASKDTMPPLPPNVINKPSKLTSFISLPAETSPEVKPISTNGCEIKSDSNNAVEDTSMIGTCRLTAEEQADLVSGIFWIGVCLLDSDYEYEYLAGIRILSRLLPCVCSPSQPSIPKGLPDLHEHIMKLHHRLKWTTGSSEESDFPGLLALLLKGCFSSTLIDASCRLLVSLIPFVKSPVVDPFAEARQNRRGPGISGTVARSFGTSASSGSNYPGPLPSLIITLLPLLLTAWDEDPESTLSSTTPEITDACEMCAESTPGIPLPTPALSLNSPPPPLGSWVHRFVVQSESSVPSPSSGYLSLVTLTIISGAAAKKSPQVKPCNPLCIQAAENLAELAVQCDAYRFNNLAVVLRLYASGGFSKDVNQWAKCVTRYLMDGCANLGPKLLSYLTAFLTLGPPCAQLPLLHFAYWFFQAVELNQSDMNTRIRSFITSTSERFVNTPLWPEVTLLYQVIVARSATLTAAPSNPAGVFSLPGLDPSGSGRVLDSLAAAAAAAVPLPEAEPQRIALAGRVLDFDTSILASTPLIAGGKGQASSNLSSNNPAAASSGVGVVGCQYRSPTRMAHLVEGCNVPGGGFAYAPFFFRLGAWKTPWNRQSRLRSLFTNLLNCYGSHLEHITAPRSPSNSSRQKVIFSQSTETLDRQLSMHSSSETTSINDASNPDDGNFDDTSSAERAAVFHDLDTYLDAQLMNINFLDLPDQNWEDQSRCPRWGVRGHSITSHTEFHDEVDDTNQQPQQQQQAKHFQNPVDDFAAATTSGNVLATIPFQHGGDDDLMADEDLVVNNFDEDGLDPTATTNGADFLSYSEPRHIPLRRQSQLSIQLSTASSVNSASFAAPPPPQSRSWRSRDDSSLKWLPDNTTIIPPIESSRYSRKRTLSMQPPIVCSRRRRQDLAALGGSLDSLPSQHQASMFKRNISGPQQQQPVVRGSTQKVTTQRSSSTVSSVSSASFKSKEMLHQQQQQPPAKPPRRKHRPSRQSLELTTLDEPPAVPLRLSSSSNAILKTPEASKSPFNEPPLMPTPAETAWIACQCQLKMLQQTSSSSVGVNKDEMTSGQRDRLRLLLASLRSVFAGMLRRTTEGAVEMANSAFSRCPPSSDLDPEIRISHLVKIAEIIHDFLPSLFFDLHPNSIHCLDDQTMNHCLQLGSMYEEWDESIRRLSVTCAPVDAPDWKQHERICRDLQTVLQRLVNFFSWSADILYKVKNSLLLKGITDFSHNLIEPLFNQMRPYLLSSPSKSHSEVLSGIDSWKVHCGRLLISKTPDDGDVRTALSIYSESMKSNAPISMDDIMAILEACCDQLWLERKSESGFALLFARGRVPGVNVFEVLASNQSMSSLVFPTDNLPELNSQDVLPPLELIYKLQKLLEC
ncbi:unnamed protein product [Hymenolepis diminuta]|uniref:Cell morphogenesis protein C-terminal domain-containing protein n=2 Tax=Hymenolepis diminuta TaxID=6216 RepID=A0A564Y7M1_HYMDI|nr:unnamed protein product [Hymenolepis diminuta]